MKRFLLAVSVAAPAITTAQAQVIERNLPPLPQAQSQQLPVPELTASEQDDSPIAGPLKAIVILGPEDAPLPAASPGIDVSRVQRMNTMSAYRLISAYIGRPLSRRLLAALRADIAYYYRTRGYPFVSITTPEQEVTQGVLQIRVVEFKAGQIQAQGNKRTPNAFITNRIRQQSNEAIEAPRLAQDLDWLNRHPFRNVEALFSPGNAVGRSNLTLSLAETKPWRVYAGLSDSGSEATGQTRMFAGLQTAPVSALPDLVLSYQFTGSDDVFDHSHAGYVSHAAVVNYGFAPRQAIELTFNRVETNQSISFFGVRQITTEAALGWRGALGLIGDLRIGVEARRAERNTFFGTIPVFKAEADVVQLYGGFERASSDRLGRSVTSLTLHYSPGGIGHRNNSSAYTTFSSGRVTESDYVYLDASYTRSTQLGRFILGTELIGRVASAPLPNSEQIGIGGTSLVRGYTLDDGAYDCGIVLRNTLYAPAIPLFKFAGLDDALQPYVFLDGGYARERAGKSDVTAISTGLGATYRLGRYLAANVDVARALNSAAYTEEGDWRAHARLTLSY